MTQEQIIKRLNDLDLFGTVEPAIFRYEHFDCFNDNYLIEIKSRQREYNPWLIEKYKYDKNIREATKQKKLFVYVTEFRRKLIIWNITDLTVNGYNFNWEVKRQPQTTEFNFTEPIPKRVGYLLEQFGKIVK